MVDDEPIKEQYALTKEQLEDMYKKAEELIFYKKQIQTFEPIAILTGGQPGAGKSSLVVNAKKQFKNIGINPIILDGDTYRGLYPKATEIAKKHPKLYSEITDKAVGTIMGRLIENTISKGYNFIREGTLNSAEIVDQLLNSNRNYKIIIRLLAVSKEESLLCIFERYIAMRQAMGIGRLTTIQAHNKRYEQFPKTAGIQANKGVEIEVYERTKDIENLKIIYKTFSNNNRYSCFEEALVDGRQRSFLEYRINAKNRLKNINEKLSILDKDDIGIKQQLEELNYIIEKSINLEEFEIYK